MPTGPILPAMNTHLSPFTRSLRAAYARWRAWPRQRRLLAIGAAVLIMGLGGGWAWLTHDLPPIDRLADGLALPSTRIHDRHGRLLYEIIDPASAVGGRNIVIPLEAVPVHCQHAVIATEDANFYAHAGVDAAGVVRALWINVQGGEVVAGGSTITQQVARLLLFDPQQRAERTLRRKLREMILALQVQAHYSKDEVLALYLNQVYFGNLAYGIEAAANAYFGVAARHLSLAQCALLAGLLQSPARYDPLTDLPAARARQSVVLGLMTQTGYITADQATLAAAEPLHFAAVQFPIEAPHFVMGVIRQLEREYGDALYQRGLVVTTTLDLDWQHAAERIMRDQLDAINHPPPGRQPADADNAALVALDPRTGEIRALVGSPDYFDEAIDGAVNAALALRQPGSTLKPFTYAAAFDPALPAPWTPATMVLDVATPFVTRRLESYTPANFGLVEHGPVSVREALASSFNIPAVLAAQYVGVPALVELATNAGITTLAANPNLDLAVTLGGGEVRLLDLTAAYSIFANGGYRVDPQWIVRVAAADAPDDPLYAWQPPPLDRPVIDPRVAYAITDILSDDDARIPGFGRHSALNIGQPAAAKTGTTTDFRDNWVVGYTPDLVVGVWVGNADNRPMIDVTGVSGAAPIWNRFMRAALAGSPQTAFAPPPGMVRLDVCAPSGLLPSAACPRTRTELFIDGTQPTIYDTFYQIIATDSATGLQADDSTPPDRRVVQTYLVLPPEAREWAIRNGVPQPPPAPARLIVAGMNGAASAGAGGIATVRLLDPDPYTVFELSTVIPASAQRLPFRTAAPPDALSVTYRLNGIVIGSSDRSPYTIWWTLAAGDYTLTAAARLASGTTVVGDPVPFSVVPPNGMPP